MKPSTNVFLGKTIYSLIFMAFLPAGLLFWTKNVERSVGLPAVQSTAWGAVLALAGGILMVLGMDALWRFGKGLPMNAYPPPNFVRESVFGLLPHPIYTGFVLLSWGISVYFGSAAGFWLVSPTVLAGCAALVWGYERLDLQQRFPSAPRQYRLAIPPGHAARPRSQHRLSVYVCLLLPWVLLNAAAFWAARENGSQAPLIYLPVSELGPVFQWITGALVLAWVAAAPLAASTQQQLRQFFISGLVGGSAVLYLAYVVPGLGLGHLTNLDAGFWIKAGFSVSWFWIWLAARLYNNAFPGLRALSIGVAVVLTLGLLANSTDPALHLISGGIGLLFAVYYPVIWEFLRESAESVANSWKEWVFGPVRVINHGFYAGLGAFAGTLMGGLLAGEKYAFPIVVFGVIGIVCAGLWGQFIEGSDKLKRPFGYYGSVAGIALACLVMYWMGVNIWVMLGVFSVFMPWVQAIGRLRCLVNGCCHGSAAKPWLGIRYEHPRSRVCFISHMKGKPLHPTPLYSILWLTLAGGLQLRLWLGGADLSLLFGTYLMLNGLGRFVEEAYRGEPQTPVLGKLRLYQWAAIASVLAGIVITAVFHAPIPALSPGIGWQTLACAAFIGVFNQFMMGIDFPRSQMRFSRLT